MSIPNKVYFLEGYASFLVGDLVNPYHPKRQFDDHREWQRGFDQGYFDELNKTKEAGVTNGQA